MKRKFKLGQRVGLLWEKTPYNAEGMLKVGTITRMPLYASTLFGVDGVNPNEPTKIYEFYPKEMIDISSPALNGDVL